jgi:eukaryotic-like serine/threonine-protein kinase
MRARVNPAEALVTLPRLGDSTERRASWRQAVTALGQSVRVTGPPPLDGVDTDQLVRSVGLALETGLADDVEWIAPHSAAVALYELMMALPPGRERRELGRRVFTRLYEGTASTFAAVATRMALGSGKPLEAATIRARVGLVLDLPVGTAVDADALALSLAVRRELSERWIDRPSVGPLPSRRLAAKLLEHAAREAVQRSQQADPHPRELLAGETMRPLRRRLIGDREPLVWRHAAVARGLLAAVDPQLREQIELALDPSLTPTEWRSASVSLVACLASDPKGAMKSLKRLLDSEIVRRDPGITATMIWGLPRVVEAEPDAAEELLDRLSATRRPDVAEATAGLLADVLSPSFGRRAAGTLRAVLASKLDSESAAARAISERALGSLDRSGPPENTIEESVGRALVAYETTGARAAYEHALAAVSRAQTAMDRIHALDAHDETTLPELLTLLGDIDSSALERSRLSDLLLLGHRPGDGEAIAPELERMYDSLGKFLLDAEERMPEIAWTRSGSLANQRRLRALLHLIDVESARAETDEATRRVRARVRRALQVLVRRLAAGPDGAVHRILCATLARSFDAAVREGAAEPSDALLIVAEHLRDRASISAITEASTHEDVRETIAAYGDFLDMGSGPTRDPDSTLDTETGTLSQRLQDEGRIARRIVGLSRGLSAGGSYRAEALRQTVLRLGRALEIVAAARGLSELVDTSGGGFDPLGDIEAATDALRQLAKGTRRRALDGDSVSEITVVADIAPLGALVERAVSAGVPANAAQISAAIGEVTADLPEPMAIAVRQVLSRLEALPITAASDVYAIPLERRRAPLPDWLLPRRTIGAFYVVRALGSGGVSSVFVARRLEERHDPKAEAFALKVPHYDPSTARSLSEQEFMQMFREEAGALLSLPSHENLARFVTFDLAARPKPILVMELIRGVGLDRLVRSRSLTVPRAFRYLDGILSGLEAMHRVGVGHLDLKPSNVILREGETPVLVDFGLSGRNLRPGCGTLEYCAPEVLGVVPKDCTPPPTAADMYAFAGVAFEMLAGDPLFEAEDETTLMAHHVAHDGWPPRLAQLAKNPQLRDLTVVLAACLRRDPRARPRVDEVRAALAATGVTLAATAWPLVGRQKAVSA